MIFEQILDCSEGVFQAFRIIDSLCIRMPNLLIPDLGISKGVKAGKGQGFSGGKK
jgi:hypothetical protein